MRHLRPFTRPPTLVAASTAALLFLVACHDSTTAPAASPTASAAPGTPGTSVEARREALRAVIADQWELVLRTNPVFASTLGDRRYNDRWGDASEKAALAVVDESQKLVARLEAIDPQGFSEQETLDRTLLLRELRLVVDGATFEPWLMPVNHFSGVHLDLASAPSLLPFTSVKDYDDYVARLQAVPQVMADVTANMRKGMGKGLMPPRFLLGKVAEQADAIAEPKPEDSPFAAPLATFPAAVGDADRARLRAAVLSAISAQIDPAYRAFAGFVRTEYEPLGRTEAGIWSLPRGDERYAFDIREETTTNKSAEEIHELGLAEVARIQALMLGVAKKLGFADLPSFAASIAGNPAVHFTSRQAIVDLYKKYIDGMTPKLPSLFGRLPKASLEVLPVEPFQEKTFAGARYDDSSPDGSRPGHVMVNTGDYEKRTTLDVESTAYHEGVPGHHLQIAIAQETPGLAPFRQHYPVTSFIEGWALYAERLGEDVGMYQDPYSYYGHLQEEMLRAVRLVADTGLHFKHWTRQEVVDFFHAHSTIDEVDVQSETDRYIVIPGQALAYKMGQLEILELRERAKRALGPSFDIRAFHDTVLDSGALPLDVLEEQVNRWIARQTPAPATVLDAGSAD